MKHITGGVFFFVGLAVLQAQVSWTGEDYVQDFNALSASGSDNPWGNNSTLLGWYAEAAGGFGDVYRANNGSSSTGALYSYGTGSEEDRALGSISAGTAGNFAYGLRLRNDTGSTVQSLFIQFTGEQWRVANTLEQSLEFSYRSGPFEMTSPDVGNTETWTRIASLDFKSPVLSSTSGSLDGNQPENRIPYFTMIEGLDLQPGGELFLRWYDLNDSGSDHGLAIDDFMISATPVPEPGKLMLLGLFGAAVRLFRKGRRQTTPGS